MEKCTCCGSRIMLGGEKRPYGRFCNEKCEENFLVEGVRHSVPEEDLQEHALQISRCDCPQCGGEGPVDLYKYSTVYSFLIFTYSNEKAVVACRSCARKKQGLALVLTSLFGWWGFPWGLLKTPFHILQNIGRMAKAAPAQPTWEFRRTIELQLANEMMALPAEDLAADDWTGVRQAA